MSTAAIVGTGLIGSSIGLALSRAGWAVLGWDPDVDAAAAAHDAGAIGEVMGSFDKLVAAASDIIVLAGPPAATVAALEGLSTSSLVMDVAGVKRPIVAAARDVRVVGTHPTAGREISGPAGATAGLFRGAMWVVASDGAAESDLVAVEDLVRSIGATPVRMSAAAHDAAVARISHLPQLVAAALLLNAADTEGAMGLAAGSFRDITRVAASDPSLWVGLLAMNQDEVVAAMTERAVRRRCGFVRPSRHPGPGAWAPGHGRRRRGRGTGGIGRSAWGAGQRRARPRAQRRRRAGPSAPPRTPRWRGHPDPCRTAGARGAPDDGAP